MTTSDVILDPELKAFVDARLEELREPDIPCPQEEYDARLEKLGMADQRIDTLLVSSPEGVCWLHGYRSRWNKMQSSTEWPPLHVTAVHADSGRYVTFDTTEHQDMLRMTSVSRHNRLSVAEDMAGMPFIVKELSGEGWGHHRHREVESRPEPSHQTGGYELGLSFCRTGWASSCSPSTRRTQKRSSRPAW
jgi:hypothetical protein